MMGLPDDVVVYLKGLTLEVSRSSNYGGGLPCQALVKPVDELAG